MASATKTVPLSWHGLMLRLNRHLAADGKSIRKMRSRDDYFVLDIDRDVVTETRLTAAKIEQKARDLGLIATWEKVQ